MGLIKVLFNVKCSDFYYCIVIMLENVLVLKKTQLEYIVSMQDVSNLLSNGFERETES